MADEFQVLAPEHPSWCELDLCNVDRKGKGTHNSRVLTLRANPPSPLGIVLNLIQAEPAPGYPHCGTPMVTVTFVDTDDGFDFGTIPMDLETAGRLGHALLNGPRVGDTSEV